VVFEHARKTVLGLSPTDEDRALAESEELRKRLKMRWLAKGGLRIKTGSYVGVVELDCATIQVRPKLAGTELDVLAMLDYASGLHALRRLQSMRAMPDEGHDLRDLVCLLLVEVCEDLLRHGVRRDYVRREERLPVVRGRLLADRQILRRYGQMDGLECRYDEFDSDILDNRLCARALQNAARTARDDDVRARARRAASHFADVCDSHGLDPRIVAERLTCHRGNEHYRVAHQWALLLLRIEGLHDLYSNAGPAGKSFMFDINSLFESFVAQLLRNATRDSEFIVRANDNLREIICYGTVALTRSSGRISGSSVVVGRRRGVARSTSSTNSTRGARSAPATFTRASPTRMPSAAATLRTCLARALCTAVTAIRLRRPLS
jgi:5-methylcytosine-specific restriction enzyme subunit McrC